MAYQCRAPDKCDLRVPYWSNPDIRYKGVPAGKAAGKNARVLNETAATVADFKITWSRWLQASPRLWPPRTKTRPHLAKRTRGRHWWGNGSSKRAARFWKSTRAASGFTRFSDGPKIRKADDTADIKVFYEHGSMRCSYRVSFSENGKRLDLIAADTMQDPDYCPAGSLKRAGS